MRPIALLVVVLAIAAAVFFATRPPPPAHCACEHMAHETLPSATPLDGASLYQIDGAFTDQDGAPFTLASLRGSPVLVLMFYGSCTTACPMLIAQAARVDAALSESERAQLRVVLVTFDPERDTAARLHELATERSMPTPRWALLRTTDDTVRELAMALGVQYRRVPDGSYVHSAMLTALDREGRIAAQTDGLDAPIDPLVARLRELIDAR